MISPALIFKMLRPWDAEGEKMGINDWCKKVYENAKNKGFYDKGNPEPLVRHMLIVSEVAEATEDVRANRPFAEYQRHHFVGDDGRECEAFVPVGENWKADKKPEGELSELADVVIRVMDYAGSMGWDLEGAIARKHAYNVQRPYRHGGKTA